MAAHGRTGENLVVDAVVGGPPCQGFSTGGVRDSEDERNHHLLRFVDLVLEIRPKVFCLENVSGLLEGRFQSLRQRVVHKLTVEGGYSLHGFDHAVNAAHFGVPQNRRRVVLLGSRVGDAPILERPSVHLISVAEAFEGLPDIKKYRRLLSADQVELDADDQARLSGVQSAYAQRLAGVWSVPFDLATPRVYNLSLLTGSLRTVHSRKTVQRFARTMQGEVEKTSRLYRLELTGQARTLRAGSGSDRGSHTSPRPIHPLRNRVITVREAARLHGYPDWFRFHATNWHGHRQVGNSVPPPLAAAAGRSLVSALGINALKRPNASIHLGDPQWLRFDQRQARAELRLQKSLEFQD